MNDLLRLVLYLVYTAGLVALGKAFGPGNTRKLTLCAVPLGAAALAVDLLLLS